MTSKREILRISQLSSSYGKKMAIKNVNLELFKGEIVALVGANGSGKSTVLKSIIQNVPFIDKNAECLCNGLNLLNYKEYQMAKLGINYLPQKKYLFQEMTISENLKFLGGIKTQEKLSHSLDALEKIIPTIKNKKRTKVDNLSGGEKKILAVFALSLRKPKVALLDEPFAGVDSLKSTYLSQIIEELKQSGTAVLIVEHRFNLIKELVDRYVAMENGRLLDSDFSKISYLQNAII